MAACRTFEHDSVELGRVDVVDVVAAHVAELCRTRVSTGSGPAPLPQFARDLDILGMNKRCDADCVHQFRS